MRFTKTACHQTAGELLPRHFTLTGTYSSGGIFSVALALKSAFKLIPLGFTQHPALWSPDFPRRQSLRDYSANSGYILQIFD